MNNNTKQTVAWLFGRGASISCGLNWVEPFYYKFLPRTYRSKYVDQNINNAMGAIKKGANPYHDFLDILQNRNIPNWDHIFLTTNWDWLLQREINDKNYSQLPSWLLSSHVFHLNGSVEPNFLKKNRHELLFESDSFSRRKSCLEVSNGISYFFGASLFIVVGMSFQCKMDETWFDIFKCYQGNLPIGVANWLVVTPDNKSRCKICYNLQNSLEDPTIIIVNNKFEDWITAGFPELVQRNILSNR